MGSPFLWILLALITNSPFSSSSTSNVLHRRSSLSVEKPQDVLVSPNGVFSAGFHRIPDDVYYFAIWFTEPLSDGNSTVVWMANRDQPINKKGSKLSLHRNGDLVLTDAGLQTVWSTDTRSSSLLRLLLLNNGNLVLCADNNTILWQSFDHPTNTLLPEQPFTTRTELVSSRSRTNHSSGFYKLHFRDDNVLRLVFEVPEMTSVYWPRLWQSNWEGGRYAGRFPYNNTIIAVLDRSGHITSSDNLNFSTVDYGLGPQRRITIDVDGNIRVYSLDDKNRAWQVTWQAFSQPCTIHGVCGANSICINSAETGRSCSCLPGHKMKNHTDWSYGCEPEFNRPCDQNGTDYYYLNHVDFWGYDIEATPNLNLDACKNLCSSNCKCLGFLYYNDRKCYPKHTLFNGYRSPGFTQTVYLKVPPNFFESNPKPVQELNCSNRVPTVLDRNYKKKPENQLVKFILRFATAVGGLEIILIASFFLVTREPSRKNMQGYVQLAMGCKRFTYGELKKASNNFRAEIGRGSGGVVYKGNLPENQAVAIKQLNQSDQQGEAEFLAEVRTIGRLNHMNLIKTLGYCFEGKHRLLVYEYMEHGSLADNLRCSGEELDWKKKLNIALGTARGLAYLHEECLEWVLHCDVKPQNILLDSAYEPKVADFGLSKLMNRGGAGNSSFSRIRGTRGYMAPEWVSNQPITSKVDVYSYGIVMLEMVAGRRFSLDSDGGDGDGGGGGLEQRNLVNWVREKMNNRSALIEEIVVDGEEEEEKERVKNLIRASSQCVVENKDARPTMSQVVDMLFNMDTE